MIKMAALQYNADLIIPLDADEYPFLIRNEDMPLQTITSIKEYLKNLN